MVTKIYGGTVVLDNSLKKADVYFEDGKITAVTNDALPFDEEIDATGKFVSPGFIDTHTHGAADFDFLDGTVEAYIKIAEAEAKHGATTVLPTITSSGKEEIIESIKAYNQLKGVLYNGADMPGLHLEGPYFSPKQSGAQPTDKIRCFEKDEYSEILSYTDSIIRWSAAPELDGEEEFAKTMKEHNIFCCIAHSDADGDCVKKAFADGFTHVTHLYSCTSTVHRKNAYRYIGIIECAYLFDDMTVEIIADGIHLPADLLKLIYKLKGADRIALVTDSMRGAGMPDGPSVIGHRELGTKVILEDGVAKLPDRSCFAGSIAFCDRLVRNMINMAEVPMCDAVKMMTATPAKIFGLENVGSIKAGYDADIVIFDDDINVSCTIVKGRRVYNDR